MDHLNPFPSLKLYFGFEISKGLQKIKLPKNELNDNITEKFINKNDKVFVATHNCKSNKPTNIHIDQPK